MAASAFCVYVVDPLLAQAQWDLQRNILARTRSLGITNQLPGFQGNVPWVVAALQHDTNITQQVGSVH